jgi:hypothetical protein
MSDKSGDEGAADIAARCRADGGLTQATLGELRAELGYRKLGRWVLEEIAETLGRARLGYFPLDQLDPEQNSEPRQHQTVWIYDKGDDVRARVLDAILEPDKHDVRGALDGLVAGRASALSADEKLARIRELVCE